MRDDVTELFLSLLGLMKTRLFLLGEFLQSIRVKRHLLKSGDIAKVQAMTERDALRIEEIDLLGAYMAEKKTKILAVCGFPDDCDFNNRFLEPGNPLFDEYRALKDGIAAVMADAKEENERLLGELEKSLGRTGCDIEDLRRIIGLKERIGRDEDGG